MSVGTDNCDDYNQIQEPKKFNNHSHVISDRDKQIAKLTAMIAEKNLVIDVLQGTIVTVANVYSMQNADLQETTKRGLNDEL